VHNENEAERMIRVVGATQGLFTNLENLMQLKKGDRRKLICAAIANAARRWAIIGWPNASPRVMVDM
jgi:hypothetical protein